MVQPMRCLQCTFIILLLADLYSMFLGYLYSCKMFQPMRCFECNFSILLLADLHIMSLGYLYSCNGALKIVS